MNLFSISKLGATVCAVVLAFALAGCAPTGASTAAETRQANHAYMSRVNETMVELGASLDQFVDAVSRDDVVNMRTQAENAYKQLDKLADIEAPDDMKDIRESYVSGTTKLKEALDSYIDLYTETSQSKGAIKSKDFNERIASIQSLYDEGVSLLQKADEAVAVVFDDTGSMRALDENASAVSANQDIRGQGAK